MTAPEVIISPSITCANDQPFVLFGGINVLESRTWRCAPAGNTSA